MGRAAVDRAANAANSRYTRPMTATQRTTALVIGIPAASLALAGTIWLWLRFGMGVYFDTIVSGIAACL